MPHKSAKQIPELLRVSEAARYLNVTESCLRKWIFDRRIGVSKISRRVLRIPRAECDRIIEGGARPAETEERSEK